MSENSNKPTMDKGAAVRDGFSSKFGIIAAAAGSAIGLGNIWKFPYITGQNGGAAFIIIYLICIALIGAPVMLSEFLIGRRAQRNAVGSFKKLAPGTPWFLTGWMGIAAAFMILSFYGVVAGWTIHYVILSVTNAFSSWVEGESVEVFVGLISGADGKWWLPVLYQVLFMILTSAIVLGGVKDGIEKYSKILMPLLLVLIIALDIRAITLPGAGAGVEFLFKPDFSKIINNPASVLDALGHAFFSLSLGMGTMITYGSYIGKKENLGVTSIQVTIADTVIALLAGLAIFPAVFAYGIDPAGGPGLVFMTLPAVFAQMPLGALFAVMFFGLLTVAALTSSVSILEVVVAYFKEELNMTRTKATIIAGSVITAFGAVCSLSYSDISFFNKAIFPTFEFVLEDGTWTFLQQHNFFDWFDKISANFLLPLGGLFIIIFVAWKMKKEDVKDEVSNSGALKVGYFVVFEVLAKYVAPIGIILVFLHSIGVLRLISWALGNK